MSEVDKEAVVALSEALENGMRSMINEHTGKASELAVNSADPHTPIIAFIQMALAQASVKYLLVCGVPLPAAVQATTELTGRAMQAWLQQVSKQHGKKEKN